jgi:signal transduction histidine kinase
MAKQRFRLTPAFAVRATSALGAVALAVLSVLLVHRSDAVTLAGWGLAAVTTPLLVGGTVRARRLARRQGARAERLARVADAATRLAGLREPAQVIGSAEAMTRDLIPCDEARITLGDPVPDPAAPARLPAHRLSVTLRRTSGIVAAAAVKPGEADAERLGYLTLSRARGPAFGDEDTRLLRQWTGAVAGALECALLSAETARAKADLERTLDGIVDGIGVFDRQWRVRYLNRAASRALRRGRRAPLGTSLWDMFPGLRDSAFGERLAEAALAGDVAEFSGVFAPLNAWFEARCYPHDGGLILCFRDATAWHEADERSRQSQKLEALGQLTGGIAHDVNNLLTVILGDLEMLAMSAEERGGAGAADRELAMAGLRAGNSASQLIHRLLAFSRRQPRAPQVVDVSALLRELEPLVRRTVGETIDLSVTAEPGLWPALADPAGLENAILNLAINGRDAMPAGGKLAIAASNVGIDQVYAAIAGLERTGDFVMVSVADSGAGMPPEVQERAFDPFFTTKLPGKGTGLGLAMVYGFVQQSGGHVMIDSEPGEGTIIRLYLPRTLGEPAAPVAEPSWEAHGGTETILLVEDDELLRTHTAAMLRGLGYTVLVAADGAEALLLLQEGLRPNLLLTDLVLPGGIGGREVADAAARLVPGLRVLFTSGYGTGAVADGRSVPPEALIGKPYGFGELASRIRAALAAPPAGCPGRDPRDAIREPGRPAA